MKKQLLYPLTALLLIIVASAIAYLSASPEEKVEKHSGSAITSSPSPDSPQPKAQEVSGTQPQKTQEPGSKTTQSETQQEIEDKVVDIMVFYNMLDQVGLDAEGKLIIDQQTKSLLQQAYGKLGPDVDEASLKEINRLIKSEHPGASGEQIADVLTSYYQYKNVENQLIQQQDQEQEMTLQNYEELKQLRRSYLEDRLADQLFAEEELHMTHMIKSIALEKNTELSSEQKELERQRLSQEFTQNLETLKQEMPGAVSAASTISAPATDNPEWTQKLKVYQQEKQLILDASIDDEEKGKQILSLQEQYFSQEEIKQLEGSL